MRDNQNNIRAIVFIYTARKWNNSVNKKIAISTNLGSVFWCVSAGTTVLNTLSEVPIETGSEGSVEVNFASDGRTTCCRFTQFHNRLFM